MGNITRITPNVLKGLTGSSNGAVVTKSGNSLVYTTTLTNILLSGGSVNNAPVGNTTPSTGAFTTLSASGAATLNGVGNKVTVSGTGSTYTVNPATTGSENNVNIGATTPGTGAFTTLSSTGLSTLASLSVAGAATLANLVIGTSGNSITAPVADAIGFTTNGTEKFRIDSAGNLTSLIPGFSGLYPSYFCRAWALYDPSPVVVRGSGNVTSITNSGSAITLMNLLTAMPDANFATTSSAGNAANGYLYSASSEPTSASQVRSQTGFEDTPNPQNSNTVSVAVFR